MIRVPLSWERKLVFDEKIEHGYIAVVLKLQMSCLQRSLEKKALQNRKL
jgi:hypothetical protein